MSVVVRVVVQGGKELCKALVSALVSPQIRVPFQPSITHTTVGTPLSVLLVSFIAKHYYYL